MVSQLSESPYEKKGKKKKGNDIFFDFSTNEEKPFSFHQYFFPMPRYYVLPLNRSRWGIFLTSLHSSPLSYLSSYLLIHWSTLDFWHYNCRMRHFCNPDIWLNERNFVSLALARYRLHLGPTKVKMGINGLFKDSDPSVPNKCARNPIRPHESIKEKSSQNQLWKNGRVNYLEKNILWLDLISFWYLDHII